MARAATTSDVFNAIAEPRRREIIGILGRRRVGAEDVDVSELVEATGLPQPAVSKHLAVLRKTGIVSVTRRGQHRLYRLMPRELKPVFDWSKHFEHFWNLQVDRIKARAEQKAREQREQQVPPVPRAEKSE